MTRFVDRLEEQLVEAARTAEAPLAEGARTAEAPRRRHRRRVPLSRVAVALGAVGLVALALAIPIAVLTSGGGGTPAGASALEGRWRSAFTERPDIAAGRGFRAGSRLRIGRDGSFSLETDTYGLTGTFDVEGDMVSLQSPGGYSRLPNLTTGPQQLPDPEGDCQIRRGSYRWRVERDQLRFRAVSDPCAARTRQLTARAWTRVR